MFKLRYGEYITIYTDYYGKVEEAVPVFYNKHTAKVDDGRPYGNQLVYSTVTKF